MYKLESSPEATDNSKSVFYQMSLVKHRDAQYKMNRNEHETNICGNWGRQTGMVEQGYMNMITMHCACLFKLVEYKLVFKKLKRNPN